MRAKSAAKRRVETLKAEREADPLARSKRRKAARLRAARDIEERAASNAHVTFPGALAWPFVYPWPQRPAGLIETAFTELGRRWRPILDAFDQAGVLLLARVRSTAPNERQAGWVGRRLPANKKWRPRRDSNAGPAA